jgi:hypothetical protein
MIEQQRNQDSDEQQKHNSKTGTNVDEDATAKGYNDTPMKVPGPGSMK